MMKTRQAIVGLIVALFLLLPAWVGAQEKAKVFKLGHIVGATSTHGLSLEKFAKAVEAETKGQIKINVAHGASLGSGPENVEQVRMGTVEMSMLWYNFMANLDPRFPIEDLPFAWSNRKQVYAAYQGELGAMLRNMAAKHGIKVLAHYELGYRCVTNSKRPIQTPDDLKGLKMRIAEVKTRLDTFRALGANPIPIAFGELYTALQLGTVDGQENPVPLIHASKFYEVQKYLSLTKHVWTTGVLAINAKAWAGLTPDQQKIMQRAADKYAEYNDELVRTWEVEKGAELAKLGMQVNEVNLGPFIKAVQPVWDKYRPVFGKEIMDLVQKYTGAK